MLLTLLSLHNCVNFQNDLTPLEEAVLNYDGNETTQLDIIDIFDQAKVLVRAEKNIFRPTIVQASDGDGKTSLFLLLVLLLLLLLLLLVLLLVLLRLLVLLLFIEY